ncbi:sigma-70 family RNA polymerase sigma factor [Pseudoneobacillus sp. C159]
MESFEALKVQYERMIHSIIRSLHIYKNIDEYFQIGLIGLWQASENFDEKKGCFSSFAYTMIKGKILTALQKNKLFEERNVYVQDEVLESIADNNCTDPNLETLLNSYCTNLTEKEKKWFLYTTVYRYKMKEIAEKEKVSVSAVKGWRAGAREKIARKMLVR